MSRAASGGTYGDRTIVAAVVVDAEEVERRRDELDVAVLEQPARSRAAGPDEVLRIGAPGGVEEPAVDLPVDPAGGLDVGGARSPAAMVDVDDDPDPRLGEAARSACDRQAVAEVEMVRRPERGDRFGAPGGVHPEP